MFVVAAVAACTPIEPVPLSNAPVNRCGCDGYASAQVRCNPQANRCESGPTGSRPTFPFFLAVHVPDSGFYGARQTFVLYSGEGGAPAFTRVSTPTALTNCTRATGCVALGGMSFVSSQYRVTESQSKRVGFPLTNNQLIPARVEFEPIASLDSPDFSAGLPIESLFVSPRVGSDGASTSAAFPSGVYRRILYPEPPFDALFPPRATFDTDATGKPIESTDRLRLPAPPPQSFRDPSRADYQPFVDTFVLSDGTIDPGDTRSVSVQRAEGLDGWQVWVEDSSSKRRISTLKTLSGATQTLTMDTTGERRSPTNNGLGDAVQVVVAPPASYLAVPRFINPVNGGDLGTIRVPSLPAPVRVLGSVVEPTAIGTLGYGAHISFESTTISTLRDPNPLLHYSATVDTDDQGRFATLLPTGTYTVTVEPYPGTGFAKSRQLMIIDRETCVDDPSDSNGCKALTLQPSKRTAVTGRVVLADMRPVAEATILAIPQTLTSSSLPKPGPNQTRASLEGRFFLELDQGPYSIVAIPKAGTGFPRVVTRVEIPPDAWDLSDIVVPAPISLSFTLRGGEWNERPVVNANVRVFALPGATNPTEAVEIGAGTTDASGLVEILLAPGPT